MANEISKLITPDGVSHDIADAQSRSDLLLKAQLVLISSNDYNNLSNDAKHDLTKAYFVYDADPMEVVQLQFTPDSTKINSHDITAYKYGRVVVINGEFTLKAALTTYGPLFTGFPRPISTNHALWNIARNPSSGVEGFINIGSDGALNNGSLLDYSGGSPGRFLFSGFTYMSID